MLEHMFACDDKMKVPRLLPTGTRVAHKTGSVNSSRTDAGIIESPSGPIAFCILTNKNKDQRWTRRQRRRPVLREDRLGHLSILQCQGRSASRPGCADAADGRRGRFGRGAAADAQRADQAVARHRHRRRLRPRDRRGGQEVPERRTGLEPTGIVDDGNLEGARPAGDGRTSRPRSRRS